MPSVIRQKFSFMAISVLVAVLQLVTGPAQALELPGGTLLPGSGWAALSVIALTVVALFWYRTRFKDAQKNSALHREALDAMEQAVLLADWRGQTVLSNSKWSSRVSDASAGLAGLKSMLFDDVDNRHALQELEIAAAAHESAQRDIAIIDGNGHKAWCQLSVKPIDGAEPMSLWTLTDSEVRNAVDAAISSEQELLTEFLNEFPIGYFSVDAEGAFVQVNDTAAEWLATTPDEMINGDRRLQSYFPRDHPSHNSPWSVLPSSEAVGCGNLTLVGEDGRRF